MAIHSSSTRLCLWVVVTIWGMVPLASKAQDTDCVLNSDGEVVCTASQAITGTRITEPTAQNAGHYPYVMAWRTAVGSCTATVIAPYAVLTAQHCGWDRNTSVTWPATGLTMQVQSAFTNPYTVEAACPEGRKVNWPHWFQEQNNVQIAAGGRSCANNDPDWPAMHDHQIGFVPQLTPAFMARNRLREGLVRAKGSTGELYQRVGVSSGPNSGIRKWINQTFVPAIPDNLDPGRGVRDGYLRTDHATGHADPGDSGGPTFGALTTTLPNGSLLQRSITLMGTTQNDADISPTGYEAGIVLTENQRDTIRKNQLWIRSRMDDVDGDGLPSACDPAPNAANRANENLCPKPVGSRTPDYPDGRLECKPGYHITGISGRDGWLIDQLAVQCTPAHCFDQPGNTSDICKGAYATDAFGGTGGMPYRTSCGKNKVLNGFSGRATQDSLISLSMRCSYLSPRARPPNDRIAVYTVIGNDRGRRNTGNEFERACAGKLLTGIDVHSADGKTLTSLQLICSDSSGETLAYVGGHGGQSYSLKCPAGNVMVGMMYQARQRRSDRPAFVGFLCEPLGSVRSAGPDTAPDVAGRNATLSVLHGSYQHRDRGVFVPAGYQQYQGSYTPQGILTRRCPEGEVIKGTVARSGGHLDFIRSMICDGPEETANQDSSVVLIDNIDRGILDVEVVETRCNGQRSVTGLYVRSGWLLDGMALYCEGV